MAAVSSLSALARRSFSSSLRNNAAAAAAHAGESSIRPWKLLSLLVAMPAIGLCMVNAFTAEHEAPPEFKEYEHLRLRTKRFPWGDGNKSLFHNSHLNALPTGYEEDH